MLNLKSRTFDDLKFDQSIYKYHLEIINLEYWLLLKEDLVKSSFEKMLFFF